ncbi:unnamed protein product [Linum trigynum]|uniref:Uncharacterized protein n=1 Tax=Linum trigynum TaxID=586398 RepID=A0AAV2FXI2_9ROSI
MEQSTQLSAESCSRLLALWVELDLATETTGFDGDDWLRRKQRNEPTMMNRGGGIDGRGIMVVQQSGSQGQGMEIGWLRSLGIFYDV